MKTRNTGKHAVVHKRIDDSRRKTSPFRKVVLSVLSVALVVGLLPHEPFIAHSEITDVDGIAIRVVDTNNNPLGGALVSYELMSKETGSAVTFRDLATDVSGIVKLDAQSKINVDDKILSASARIDGREDVVFSEIKDENINSENETFTISQVNNVTGANNDQQELKDAAVKDFNGASKNLGKESDIAIQEAGDYLEFDNYTPEYKLGAGYDTSNRKYTLCDQQAKLNSSSVKGNITYEFDDDSKSVANNLGLVIDEDSGEVSVSETKFKTLVSKVEENLDKSKETTVKVVANKTSSGIYSKDKADYTLTIKFDAAAGATFADAIALSDATGNDGWYKKGDNPTSAPKDTSKYSISLADENFDFDASAFKDSVALTKEGENDYSFYLKDKTSGALSKKYTTPNKVKIDTVKPDSASMSYSFADLLRATEINNLKFGFAKINVGIKVTFKATDATPGSELDKITWTYKKNIDASNSEKYIETKTEDVDFNENGEAEATINITDAEQFRGSINFVAIDKAGNVSDEKSGKDTDGVDQIIGDSQKPVLEAIYGEPSAEVGDKAYYGTNNVSNAKVTLNITEANFFIGAIPTADNEGVPVVKVNDEDLAVTWSRVNDTDVYTADVDLSGKPDGEYVITTKYTDFSGNNLLVDGEEKDFTSKTIVIDTAKPEVNVEYIDAGNIKNELTDTEGNSRKYYADSRTATIKVTEKNFDENVYKLVARNAAGEEVDVNGLVKKSSWETDGDVHTLKITYSGNSNYTFAVDCVDLAKNKAENTQVDYFTIDNTTPTITSINASRSILDTILSGITFGFYNAPATLTVTATDDVSGVNSFTYLGNVVAGASGVNSNIPAQVLGEPSISYGNGRSVATISFKVPEWGQFNGNVFVEATDRSGNATGQTPAGKQIVVDSIAPNANVTYNNAYSNAGGTSYYNGSINGTITVNEANFYAGDVYATATRNGATQYIPVSWNDANADVHIGTFSLSGDGDYYVSVSYSDKSGNRMPDYRSNLMIIDTQISEPTFTINGENRSGDNGGAYKDEVSVGYSFNDHTLASQTVKLTKTRFDDVADMTEELIHVNQSGENGSGSFDINKEIDSDGVYVLSANISDHAGHSAESHVKFVVNRYGSVYEYSDYLMSLIKDGGQFISKKSDRAITDDLLITEYNPDAVDTSSLQVGITRDSEKVNAKYDSVASASDVSGDNSASWNKYVYSINKDNFSADGLYKITLSSKDNTGNTSTSVPDNSIDTHKNRVLDQMNFTIDTTAPEIRNIVNMDKDIVDAQELPVKYTLVDVGGLDEVSVYVNGNNVQEIKDFGSDRDNYTGEFTLHESNDEQDVRFLVKDRAGNITDTADGNFNPGDKFGFVGKLIVSTNPFVRWYANKPLFWGSIVLIVAVVGGCVYLYQRKRSAADEEDSKSKSSKKA